MTYGGYFVSWFCQFAATLWWLFLTLVVRANQDSDAILSGIIVGTVSAGTFYLGSRLRFRGDALQRHLGLCETVAYIVLYRLGILTAIVFYAGADVVASVVAAGFLYNQNYTAAGQLMPYAAGLTPTQAWFWETLGSLFILSAGLWFHLYGTTYQEEEDRLGSTLHYKYIAQALARMLWTTAAFRVGSFMFESYFVVAAWLPGYWAGTPDVTNPAFTTNVFVAYFFIPWIGVAAAALFLFLALLFAAQTKHANVTRNPNPAVADQASAPAAAAASNAGEVDTLDIPKNKRT